MSGFLRIKRWRYREQVENTRLESAWRAPAPLRKTPWLETPFLVADCEMSSLEASNGELLSMGWVVVKQGRVLLADSTHVLLKPDTSVGTSAEIHHLRDCELAEGKSLQEALDQFLTAAAGKILVFHNAMLDLEFLDKACMAVYGAPLLLPAIDTMKIEHRVLQRRDHHLTPGDLQLQHCRSRYGLPRYPAHNALVDAIATAELLLAQAVQRAAGQKLKLGALC